MADSANKKRFLGIGDHKGGLGHWSLQRITSIMLIPLSLLFLYTFVTTLGDGHAAMLETYSHPWNALVAILFLATMFYHLSLGVEVVIDDYIPDPGQHKILMLLNKLLFRGLSVVAVLSVIAILFSA